jgi:hypothetical protein
MGASWESLPESTRLAVAKAVVSVRGSLTQQGLANCFWSFAVMNYTWGKMDEFSNVPVSATLVAETRRLQPELSTQSVAAILHALSKMDSQYSALDETLKSDLLAAYTRLAPDMSGEEVSVSLYGLGRMGASFEALPFFMKSAIMQSVEETCLAMGERELGNAIWALVGQMGCGLSNLSSTARDNLIKAIVKKRFSLRKQSLVAILQVIKEYLTTRPLISQSLMSLLWIPHNSTTC